MRDLDSDSKSLVAHLAEATGVAPSISRISDAIIEVVVEPSADGVAPIAVILSEHETVFLAGAGARFELGPFDACSGLVSALARSVARGGLTERVRKNSVAFEVELSDDQTLSGTTRRGLDVFGSSKTIHYEPYPNR